MMAIVFTMNMAIPPDPSSAVFSNLAAQTRLISVGLDLRVQRVHSGTEAVDLLSTGRTEVAVARLRDLVPVVAKPGSGVRLVSDWTTGDDGTCLACSEAAISKHGMSMLDSFVATTAGLAAELKQGKLGDLKANESEARVENFISVAQKCTIDRNRLRKIAEEVLGRSVDETIFEAWVAKGVSRLV